MQEPTYAFDELAIEIASKLDTLNRVANALDEGVDFSALLSDVQAELESFKTNLGSLAAAYGVIENDRGDPTFLLGTLWSGVLGTYEGFIHGIFGRLLRRDGFRILAARRVHELDREDNAALGRDCFQEVMSSSDIAQLFQRAMLNDANRAARLMSHLFEMPVPKMDQDVLEAAMSIRDAFMHNNGSAAARRVEITLAGLMAFSDDTDARVSRFAYGLIGHLRAFLAQTD